VENRANNQKETMSSDELLFFADLHHDMAIEHRKAADEWDRAGRKDWSLERISWACHEEAKERRFRERAREQSNQMQEMKGMK
jgi:hypothetical protein